MLSNSPFFQLYRARLREFWRQPARIFWVYGFPTVLEVPCIEPSHFAPHVGTRIVHEDTCGHDQHREHECQ